MCGRLGGRGSAPLVFKIDETEVMKIIKSIHYQTVKQKTLIFKA